MLIPRNFNYEKKIIILSSAGLDVPSGLQTFRGSNVIFSDWVVHKSIRCIRKS
jgi:NAD-dependent SIR2 family protein deacetylase